jgi:hypothetical protein
MLSFFVRGSIAARMAQLLPERGVEKRPRCQSQWLMMGVLLGEKAERGHRRDKEGERECHQDKAAVMPT